MGIKGPDTITGQARREPRSGRARKADALPAPHLWTAFVLGWVSVLGFVVWVLAQAPIDMVQLPIALSGITTLAALFLWLTLHGALVAADLTPGGPSPAVVRRRLLTLGAIVAIVIALVALIPEGDIWWLFMYASVAAGLALPAPLASGVIATAVILAIICAWLITGQIEAMLLLQIAFGAGAINIRHLTITVGQLRAAREEVAQLAVAEERLRFARDLHDLLGHSLSVIVLKAELAGRLLPAAPERAAGEVQDMERTAREALRQVRAVVADYRQPVLHGELAAARELLAAAGISTTIVHNASGLSSALDSLLAWTVREGVTNVIRHSRAQRCVISIDRINGRIRVEVVDDGRGAEPAMMSSGNGLAGLAERAAAHGGAVQAGSLPDHGFSLALDVPESTALERSRS